MVAYACVKMGSGKKNTMRQLRCTQGRSDDLTEREPVHGELLLTPRVAAHLTHDNAVATDIGVSQRN